LCLSVISLFLGGTHMISSRCPMSIYGLLIDSCQESADYLTAAHHLCAFRVSMVLECFFEYAWFLKAITSPKDDDCFYYFQQ